MLRKGGDRERDPRNTKMGREPMDGKRKGGREMRETKICLKKNATMKQPLHISEPSWCWWFSGANLSQFTASGQ